MTGWNLAISLSTPPGPDSPLFLQIARAIMDDVRRGRLRPRDELPGSRALAQSLGVHRNTVIAAYRELSAEGWVTTDPARGTFVSSALPDVAPRRFAPAHELRDTISDRVGYALPALPSHAPVAPLALPPGPGVLSLNGGIPDVRLVPTAAIARAYRRALRRGGKALLSYADPRGCPALRVALAEMLSATRGLAAREENILVTRGSQMAIDLAARALLEPGAVVAVEALGYRPAWDALRAAGAVLLPVPLDDGGLRIDALEALIAKEPVRAIYLTPHHQYPTTAVLAPGRRLELLELARRARILVIEDDYDHEFHYDGRPVLPLASADRAGVVVYIGTLSKVLAPGLRIGYLVAPTPVVERVAARRASVDRQGDHAIEWAVAELLEDGEVQRHIRRARRIYRARRDVLTQTLGAQLGGVLSFRAPAGGTALWVQVSRRVDVTAWARRALQKGVAVQAGQQFAFDGRARQDLRLGFAQLDESELREAVRRMTLALRA
jgi:GntR family transcriptional regulator/MocR family aminotransferase